ncbi:hypothetical protein N1851_018867 [Merluccius polli]|uniref:Uncharacterized protein n=1 Tax=Merluccius polli TaxID=89951 RepID=A0AA47MMA2_MERPO|nr:hypothetical protein N1851_018867 [Merluccius polli]
MATAEPPGRQHARKKTVDLPKDGGAYGDITQARGLSAPYWPSNSTIRSPIQRWTGPALLSFQRNQRCEAAFKGEGHVLFLVPDMRSRKVNTSVFTQGSCDCVLATNPGRGTFLHLLFCASRRRGFVDSSLQLAGFQLCRADRDRELSGKTKGGGICFYINSGWCNDVTVIQQHCSPDLESFIINCKPFYSPREFVSFILVGVYIPPQANGQDAQRMLANQIRCVERTNPDSLVIVLGDFKKGNLTHKLPKYRQFIECPTREENILDHCYTTVRDAYHAVPRAALGLSDHVMVQLIPAYRQKLKLCKPVGTSRRWTSEAVEDLQACLDSTDWDVFRTATNSLDEYTEAVTSYISFCEDCCVPSRTRGSYNNDKPWFTAKLRRLRLDKEEAFRNGDKDRFKEAKHKFSKAVKEAKRLYSEKFQHQFSANDCIRSPTTSLKPPTPLTTNA